MALFRVLCWALIFIFHENTKALPDQPLIKQRTRKTLLWTKTRYADCSVYKNMALVSFRSHVNSSENFHFGSGPISCRSHVISPLAFPSWLSQYELIVKCSPRVGRWTVSTILFDWKFFLPYPYPSFTTLEKRNTINTNKKITPNL